MSLVLSLFPGIGMLDLAFEEAGHCVVRGPDLIWGGDVHKFHPPEGGFDGVIGGPPCQAFSRLRFLVQHNGYATVPNLIPEFERCVAEAQPRWFLMENVPDAPEPVVPGYHVRSQMVRDVWVGGNTSRLRRFSFGSMGERVAASFEILLMALHRTDPDPAVLASGGGRETPVAIGGSGKPKRGGRVSKARDLGYKTKQYAAAAAAQGLPADFLDGAPFTVAGKIKLIGNGVPLAMGRAVAAAVNRCTGVQA